MAAAVRAGAGAGEPGGGTYAGTRHHARKAVAERVAGVSISSGGCWPSWRLWLLLLLLVGSMTPGGWIAVAAVLALLLGLWLMLAGRACGVAGAWAAAKRCRSTG